MQLAGRGRGGPVMRGSIYTQFGMGGNICDIFSYASCLSGGMAIVLVCVK